MPIQLGVLQDASNEKVLDAIRYENTLDYQTRVPEATQAGIDATMRAITEYRPTYNEFENALVNRIGMLIGRSQSWDNPLQEFKMGMLPFGDTIEEYFVGLLKSHTYDGNRDYMEKAIWGRETPNVQANFHTVNRKEFYKVTVNETQLRQAFLAPGGLSEYVSRLMDAPITSDNWDEFLAMVRLFKEYDDNGGFYKVQVPDVSVLTSSETEAKQVLRIIRGVAGKLKFLSSIYNAAKMPMFAKQEDMVLFVTPDFEAAIDVNALAAAFNMEKAQIPFRIVTVPEEHFGIDGCQAILTTKDFFVLADQKMENTSIFNPAGLATNYFWHHWQVISASRFVPAVMFTTKAGSEVIEVSAKIESIDAINVETVDGEAITLSNVERGMMYQCIADTTTDPADSPARLGVTWGLSGNQSTRTTISRTGVLHISGTEKATSITVSAFDSNEAGNAGLVSVDIVLNITGDATPQWPTA